MIVEDEYELHYEARENESEFEYDDMDGNIIRSLDFACVVSNPPDQPCHFTRLLKTIGEINNKETHRQLREDLKQNLYENHKVYQNHTQR